MHLSDLAMTAFGVTQHSQISTGGGVPRAFDASQRSPDNSILATIQKKLALDRISKQNEEKAKLEEQEMLKVEK